MQASPPRSKILRPGLIALVLAVSLSASGPPMALARAPAPDTSASPLPTEATNWEPSPAGSGASAATVAACLDGSQGAWGPADAYELPVSQKGELQAVLDTYKIVRLQPGSYRSDDLPEITLSSGEQLYGQPGENVTAIPRVVVPGGTRDAVLSGVHPEQMAFPASDVVTQHNCFMHIWTHDGIEVNGASLEDNLFLAVKGRLTVDTRSGGYLRNNRFIATVIMHNQASADAALTLRGDTARQSGGNVFLWTNLLGPAGDGIYLENQADVSFIGFDAENWNQRGYGRSAMLRTGPMGTLRFAQANAGQTNAPIKTGIFDVAAEAFIASSFMTGGGGTAKAPHITYRAPNAHSALINWDGERSTEDLASQALRLKAFLGERREASINGASIPAQPLTHAQHEMLQELFVDPLRGVQPWERPVFIPIPDPAGPTWDAERSRTTRDDTAYIQDMIDTQGLARLPEGIFYISQPLKLKHGQGIVGAGQTKTAIVAKNSDINMIVGDEHVDVSSEGDMVNFVLVDITLQGGKNGLHFDEHGWGRGAQVIHSWISHVTLRDMAEAGISTGHIYGFDNNLFAHVNFYRNGAGVKQRPCLDCNFNNEGGGYWDKALFFHAQFVENGRGVDLQASRHNSLMAWVNSSFRDNIVYAADLSRNSPALFANTDFINNGGSPSVRNNMLTGFVSCYFQAGARGETMVPDGADVEGSTFERGASETATIVSGGGRAYFSNNRSMDMPVGSLQWGLLLNNTFAANPGLSEQGVVVNNGRSVTILAGVPDPAPRLLVGSIFRSS